MNGSSHMLVEQSIEKLKSHVSIYESQKIKDWRASKDLLYVINHKAFTKCNLHATIEYTSEELYDVYLRKKWRPDTHNVEVEVDFFANSCTLK